MGSESWLAAFQGYWRSQSHHAGQWGARVTPKQQSSVWPGFCRTPWGTPCRYGKGCTKQLLMPRQISWFLPSPGPPITPFGLLACAQCPTQALQRYAWARTLPGAWGCSNFPAVLHVPGLVGGLYLCFAVLELSYFPVVSGVFLHHASHVSSFRSTLQVLRLQTHWTVHAIQEVLPGLSWLQKLCSSACECTLLLGQSQPPIWIIK